MTIQDVIDKGYKPGMRIKCAATKSDEGTVAPVSEWKEVAGSVYVGKDDDGDRLWVYDNLRPTNQWAEIITPSKGLQEGDAVECSPAMRAAIIELAKDFRVAVSDIFIDGEAGVRWDGKRIIRAYEGAHNNWLTPEEFIARMRVTPSTKANKDCSFRLSYEKGAVKIGDVLLSNDVYRSIAKGLQD